MDIEAIKAFVKVVDEKSFSKAAEQLHITQPAITKRIQNLESRLNAQLFERLQREVMLTESGEALLPHALAILHNLDNAINAVQEIDDNVSGVLRIVASHHIGLHRLPLVLKRFSQEYPDVELQLNFLDSESAYSLLRENTADIACVTIPKVIKPGFSYHLKWQDPMSFVCSQQHPLATYQTVSASQLSEFSAILPSESTLTYRVVEEIFEESKLALSANIPTNYLETMKMMTSVGMGWSVLPNTMIDDDLKVLNLQTSSEEHTHSLSKLSRELGILSYQKKYLGKCAKAFIKTAERVWPN